MKKPNQSRLMEFIIVFSVLYLAICIGMYLAQRSMLYFPDKSLKHPSEYGLLSTEEIALTSKDNIKISAWYTQADPNNPVLVYFQGNGGHLGYRAERFELFSQFGFGLLALSYRGYGSSQGSPSEEGFYEDARAIMDFIKQRNITNPIILYGESLGTGIATKMALEYQVAGLILESPYTSLAERAQEIYFWLPAYFMIKDRFSNIDKVGNISQPLLILHGELDNIVPVKHGKSLFDKANEPKYGLFVPDQGHNMTITPSLLAEIQEFFRSNGVF